jgi:hypothetical protein
LRLGSLMEGDLPVMSLIVSLNFCTLLLWT